MKLPASLHTLVDRLSELPSIGPRQAIRIAFHLMGLGVEQIIGLSREIESLTRVKTCERCFYIHTNQGTRCEICSDSRRQPDVIMVVEKETDLISLENTGKYTGRYLVIGQIPKAGALEEWQKLRIQALKAAIEREFNGKAEEIILGFNPTSMGDFGASLIAKELEPYAHKITRLGRGLPTGGEIEFADEETLGSALERRS